MLVAEQAYYSLFFVFGFFFSYRANHKPKRSLKEFHQKNFLYCRYSVMQLLLLAGRLNPHYRWPLSHVIFWALIEWSQSIEMFEYFLSTLATHVARKGLARSRPNIGSRDALITEKCPPSHEWNGNTLVVDMDIERTESKAGKKQGGQETARHSVWHPQGRATVNIQWDFDEA